MLRSYIIIAWRNMVRSKVYSIINVSGLSLGVACCLLLALYIQDEVGFDRYHARLDDLYRVTTSIEGSGSGYDGHHVSTHSPSIEQ